MDKYTRFLMTVIAAALVWISLSIGDFISPAIAAYTDTKIEISDVSVPRHRALPVYVTGELKCIK